MDLLEGIKPNHKNLKISRVPEETGMIFLIAFKKKNQSLILRQGLERIV